MAILSILIGFGITIAQIMNLLYLFYSLSAIFGLAASLICLYGSFLWIFWLRKDEEETRKSATLACLFMAWGGLACAIIDLIELLTLNRDDFYDKFDYKDEKNRLLATMFIYLGVLVLGDCFRRVSERY